MDIPTRGEIIREVRERGELIAAVLPFHYPRALLRAYGFHPMEVWGPPQVDHRRGVQHFPEYTCDIVQKATFFLKSPEAAEVDCILIPHTCDSLQGMGSVFIDFIKPEKPVVTLYHPRGRRESDLIFIEKELRSLAKKLGDISGKSVRSGDIEREMEIENAVTRLYEDVALNREEYALSDKDFYRALRSREYLPPDRFIALLESLPKGTPPVTENPIMMSGIVPEPMDIFDSINRFGGHVAIDDFACCSRRIYREFEERDPFVSLARQMISMTPDSTVSTPYLERIDFLKKRMESKNARGLLVYDVKFCEPELFYIPLIEKAMKEEGWPFLFVEIELATEIPHQVLNRINAFMEVLS